MHLDISKKIVIALTSPQFKSSLALRECDAETQNEAYIRISSRFTVTVESKRAATSGV